MCVTRTRTIRLNFCLYCHYLNGKLNIKTDSNGRLAFIDVGNEQPISEAILKFMTVNNNRTRRKENNCKKHTRTHRICLTNWEKTNSQLLNAIYFENFVSFIEKFFVFTKKLRCISVERIDSCASYVYLFCYSIAWLSLFIYFFVQCTCYHMQLKL